MYQISRMRFAAQEKLKRATVGPLPGVTQDIAGFKIAHQPSIYVLDTPGVLVPNIPDIDTGLKLALTGAVKDSVVGEDRLAQYLLAMLNTRHVPLRWKGLNNESCEESSNFCLEDLTVKGPNDSPTEKNKKIKETKQILHQKEDHVLEVQKALFRTFSAFKGDLENEDDLEDLIESQFDVLQKTFRIPLNSGEVGRNKVSKKLLQLFRIGKLGHYILDSLPKGAS
jgi:ribosome biogenesis GTPase A